MVVDKSGMYEVLEKLNEQITSGQKLASNIKINQKPKSICIAGMGGSAIGGYILQQYMEEKSQVPVFVVENYKLPEHVTPESFLFVISYSGNTEETLEAFLDAKRRKIPMICISNGGKLKEMAHQNQVNFLELNDYPQPRLSIIEQFFCLQKIMENSGFINKEGEHIKKLTDHLKKDTLQQTAEQVAQKTGNLTPLIYASQKVMVAARVWKICMNENAKSPAFFNYFPALSHNEFQGFEHGAQAYHIIIINTDEENPKMMKRINVTKEMLEQKGAKITNLQITGECYLSKLISALTLGLWTAYFLAIKKGIDPSPVIMVEEFKKKLSGAKQ